MQSLFPCASPLESAKGLGDKLSGNVVPSQWELLAASGLRRKDPTVFPHCNPPDTSGHNNLARVGNG